MNITDCDFYITKNGRLIIPSLNINYLVDVRQSSIPSMPESSGTYAKIAGRDGDIHLSSNYEPIPFNLICYTEDGLTPTQKIEEERKINNFLNSMKKNNKKFGLEKEQVESEYYNVIYEGMLNVIRYPAHLQFSIPFKSSEPFGHILTEYKIIGNNTKTSNTVEEVGAIITIEGPATLPKISLNDYAIEYSYDILSGNKLVIDTGKSTVTHISNQGVKTNAMRYYNHQFPKIQNGTNELKVLTGIANPSQVYVQWNDLIL